MTNAHGLRAFDVETLVEFCQSKGTLGAVVASSHDANCTPIVGVTPTARNARAQHRIMLERLRGLGGRLELVECSDRSRNLRKDGFE